MLFNQIFNVIIAFQITQDVLNKTQIQCYHYCHVVF